MDRPAAGGTQDGSGHAKPPAMFIAGGSGGREKTMRQPA